MWVISMIFIKKIKSSVYRQACTRIRFIHVFDQMLLILSTDLSRITAET